MVELSRSPTAKRLNKDGIFATLRRRICLLEYPPGSRLNERELAVEFGISRTPLRAVLQRLENDGLIISRHGLGTVVAPIELSGMRDIYVIRMHLMDAVGESSPIGVSDEVLERFDRLIERSKDLPDSNSKQDFAWAIIEMHEILHGLVSNSMLKQFNDTLFYQSIRFWFQLLDALDFKDQADELLQEMALLKKSLAMHDVRLTALIHKAHLGLVLSHLNKLVGGSDPRPAHKA